MSSKNPGKNRGAAGGGARSRAREKALQALYRVDVGGADPADALAAAWKSEEEQPDLDTNAFALSLVRGVAQKRAELDAVIETHSHNWRVERMAKVDRNVLRLAVYELVHVLEVPKKVILNEAIELAKKFGSEESSGFINGILDKVAQAVRRDLP